MSLALLMLIPALFILILVSRYLYLKNRHGKPVSFDTQIPLENEDLTDGEGFSKKLASLIQIPTVSWTDRSKRDPAEFSLFQNTLKELFPLVHEHLTREVIGEFGLIYHWKGKNPNKKPLLFLAHYDVVPADEKGDETWEEPPFSGKIKDGILWGRGTLDIKSQLAFQMETAEQLLAKNFKPQGDIYFAFGGDEEISGTEGAGVIASIFRQRGLSFEFILDEGGVIAKDQLAFLKGRPAALVGLAEKGMATFKITAPGQSGHSSMPDRGGTAIGRLARAIVRLENRPFPSRLAPVMKNMLERFVPYVSPILGIIFANLWLTAPLIRFIFAKNRTTDSLIRTTQAVTVARAGEQENILPGEASCLVNHRILPGDSIEYIEKRHKQLLKDKDLVITDPGNWPANNPIETCDPEGSGFQLISKILEDTHPGVVPVPFLVNGSTDSKYYRDLTDQILRFTPLVLKPEDIASIHGINEKVSLDNLKNGLRFYFLLFRHL